MILSGNAVYLSAEAADYIAKCTIIHIKATLNLNGARINIKLISLLNTVIKHCTHKIICACYGVHIAREMKIDFLHGHNLTVAAACSAAFDAEHGAE